MILRLLTTLPLLVLLAGCPIDDDKSSGINCWDINMNHANDLEEDKNGDGVYDTQDCISQQSAVFQNQDAFFNHQHFCEAFAALGQYPDGCPSITHTTPTGTLTMITTAVLFDDSNNGYTSCNYSPSNGPLSLEYRPDTGLAYWVLEGGYTANRVVLSRQDVIENNSCVDLCSSDNKCIASFARTHTNESFDCFTMYHSDTVSDFESLCAIDEAGKPGTAAQYCLSGLGVNSRWNSICP
ncbi:MAG: hypothetical protein HWE19_02535 [Vibrionaceae bacterium]|nr:hypothetical protein [Vibrionaceae bacterium]